MPFLYTGVWFSTKLSYHRNVSLAVYLPISYFSFYQKTNFLLYKQARLLLLLFIFSVDFSIDLHCKTIILPFTAMISLLVISFSDIMKQIRTYRIRTHPQMLLHVRYLWMIQKFVWFWVFTWRSVTKILRFQEPSPTTTSPVRIPLILFFFNFNFFDK